MWVWGYLKGDSEKSSLWGDGIWAETWVKWRDEPRKYVRGKSSWQREEQVQVPEMGLPLEYPATEGRSTMARRPWVTGRWDHRGGEASSWWALKDWIPYVMGRQWKVLSRRLIWSDLSWIRQMKKILELH